MKRLPTTLSEERVTYRPRIKVSNHDLMKAYAALHDAGEKEAAERILPVRTRSHLVSFLILADILEREVAMLDLVNKLIQDSKLESPKAA